MTYIIAVVAQKGGTGKSTTARLVGTKFSGFDNGSWKVVIADMDISQGTSFNWSKRRTENRIEPSVHVKYFSRVEQALDELDEFHIMIFDGAPHASKETLKIAMAANVVIIPTGLSIDDLEPTVKLANELFENGVTANKIVFGLCRVGDSLVEEIEARAYLAETQFRTASGALPERTAYRRASDAGKAASETHYPSLNEKADEFCRSLIKQLYKSEQTKGR